MPEQVRGAGRNADLLVNFPTCTHVHNQNRRDYSSHRRHQDAFCPTTAKPVRETRISSDGNCASLLTIVNKQERSTIVLCCSSNTSLNSVSKLGSRRFPMALIFHHGSWP